jgi:hypothetical protein
MVEAIINGLNGLTVGFQMLAMDWRNAIMLIWGSRRTANRCSWSPSVSVASWSTSPFQM